MSTRWNDAVEARLNELSLVTTGLDGMLESLTHAVDIAKAGGITDARLWAMLHLANTRQMTPSTEAVLANAGIDTTPWAVVTGEQKIVPADAIVIDRVDLTDVTEDGTAEGRRGQVTRLQSGGTQGFMDSPSSVHWQLALNHLALAEYLDAHPPVPPVSDEDVETLAGLIRHADPDSVAFDEQRDTLARRLLTNRGPNGERVSVRHE